jgi:hypothetical protein
MARDMVEGSAAGPAGRARGLRELGGSLARRWPRWLRLRLPKLKLWQLAVLGLLLLFVTLWLTATATSTSTYSASLLVTEGRHGIPPPGNPFDFGDLPPGASSDNMHTFTNDGKTDIYIMIGVFGGIRDFIDIEDAFFTLKPGEERQILVKLSVPPTAEPGKHYSGKVIITRMPFWVPW